MLLPLLLVAALVVGGWFFFTSVNSPRSKLEQAHADWDSGVSTQQISAIKQYRKLLQMDNPLEPGMRWLRNDRDTLYRRIIEHEVLLEKNPRKAREWVIRAWDEGIRDLRFPEGETNDFWNETVQSFSKKKNRAGNAEPEPGVINDERLNDILAPGI